MAPEKKTACVTGGNGFMASTLIKHLLEKGYAVNTTVRDPENTAKTRHLRELQSLGEQLRVFQADLVEEGSFDEAVAGCDFVFLMAAPVNIKTTDPENELIKPGVQGTLNVLRSCSRAKTVKRVVLTSSGAAVSINKLEGSGLVMDEAAWSDLTFLTTEKPPTWGYATSKVLLEKEAFKFAEENEMSLVSVVPPLTVGHLPASNIDSPSVRLSLSLLSGNRDMVNGLRAMQGVSGSISFAHVDDLCRAHIFVAENEAASGRYICCSVNSSLPELARFLSKRYPDYRVPTGFADLPDKPKLVLSSEKLLKAGFEFQYKTLEDLYEDTVGYAVDAGLLKAAEERSI